MNTQFSWAAAGMAMLLGLGSLVSAKADKPPEPLWEVDLSQYGFQGRPPIPHGPADEWGFWTYQQGIAFTDQNVVAAYFIVRDAPSHPTDAEREPSPSDQYRLVAVFMTADKGTLLKKMDWPLPIDPHDVAESFFLPASNGNFIVYPGNTFLLYSRDFRRVAEDHAHERWEPILSPAGDTLLLHTARQSGDQWTRLFDLVDTEKLAVRASWTESRQPGTTDPVLWSEQLAWSNPLAHSIFFKTPNSEPVQLAGDKEELCEIQGFLDKNTLAVKTCGAAEKLLLVSTNGSLLQRIDLGLEQTDGPPVSSRNGKRFALPTFRWGSAPNGNPSLLRARVFELGSDTPLLQLDVQPQYSKGENFFTPYGDTRFGWGGVSLALDGKLLAVKSGPIVQLYQVPDQPQSGVCAGTRACAGSGLRPQTAGAEPSAPPAGSSFAPSLLAQQVLSWLPEDTETLIAANGPFVVPATNKDSESSGNLENSSNEIEETFQMLPLSLCGFHRGILLKQLQNRRVSLALEGSRNFRAPSGLGESPFEGADIVAFEDDISNEASAFKIASAEKAFGSEFIEGVQVILFQEKLEEDIWTTFVAFPKPNVLVAASSREYLREVLARVQAKSAQRALPATLPEWNYVRGQAEFWALRHYKTNRAEYDPTSPRVDHSVGTISDPQAVGLTFYFDPARSSLALVTYLSEDKHILENVQKNLFPIEGELGAREMRAQYRLVGHGAVQGTYDLTEVESDHIFLFVLMALLGHAIYV